VKIKEKLALQFCAIVGLILILSSLAIYLISKKYRYNAFKARLIEKALNTANLLTQVEEIDAELLQELRDKHLQSLPEEGVQIYNKKNRPVYRDDTLHYWLSSVQLENVRKNGELDFKVEERQFVAITYKDAYVVVASALNTYGQNELRKLAYNLITINILGILIIYFSGKIFASHALLPILKMIQEVDKLSESNLKLRLDEGQKKDEISRLAITFNKMFDRIEDAFERQKIFVANASHELRTPLTSIVGEIEVALMKGRNCDEYVQVLHSVLEEAKAMTALSNDLLQLAQAGTVKGLTIEKIRVEELLDCFQSGNVKRNTWKKLNIEIKNPEHLRDIFISGNIELLKIAFNNIIDNAFKFSEFKPVTILVSVHFPSLVIRIRDEGIGMNEDEMDMAFQPFFRSERVSTISGNGIGLPLTQKLIKLHQGKIDITSTHGKGTEVTVALPILKYV
jgi:two-component system sensor histidine kinase ArlS